ncbi:MAG: hypothetical protein LKM30_05240 [Bacilli bacterium]|jgi:hypothetical protein|nr:hypothetical protein [Bacilli bacterium]
MDLTWLWTSLVGVGATILGTFLGWFLGKPKNKRLDIKVSNFVEPIESRNGEGLFCDGLKDGELDSIRLGVNLVFYNPSDKIKVIRDLRIEFYNSKRVILFSCPVLDMGQAKNLHGLIIADDVPAMNVLPGYAVLFKGEYFINHDNLQKKDEIDNCLLVYNDEKMKKRVFSLGTFNFKSIVLIKTKEVKK